MYAKKYKSIILKYGLSTIFGFLILGYLWKSNCIALSNTSNSVELKGFKFPDGFVWGTATSSYQVEGHIWNDWAEAGMDAGSAVDQVHRYKEDFGLAASLGNQAHRISLEWARIEPAPGKFDLKAIKYYQDVVSTLKGLGVEPYVTLHHFTNPVWIKEKGGWTNPEVIQDFSEYVRYVAKALPEVRYWITINEPTVYVGKSYMEGAWPPFHKSKDEALEVTKNLILAHAEAYHALHQTNPYAKVGIAHHMAALAPNTSWNPIEQILTSVFNNLGNEAILQAISEGSYNIYIPGVINQNIPQNKILINSLDFIGVNYYTRWMVHANGQQTANKNSLHTDMGWEYYPQGLLEVLRIAEKYAKKMNIPIYITENGVDDAKDELRPRYLKEHLSQVALAIQEGIPVRGYFYWSLIDNFEWADGFRPKFGLIDSERKPRSSFYLYKDICHNNALP